MKTVRDLTNLRNEDKKRFSKALSLILLEDFLLYFELIKCIMEYDAASGGDKTSVGYKPLPESFTSELQDALTAYVRGVNE